MLNIVTSNNSSIFRQLGAPAFRRVGIDHHVGSDGEEVLELVRRFEPDVLIVDSELPGVSGYEVSRRVKDDPDFAATRVVVVVDGALTLPIIRELSACRCDEVLVTPAPGEELFHKVARLIGLPVRTQRRMTVELRAVATTGVKVVAGRVLDLNQDGVRLELEQEVPEASDVKLRISGSGAARPVVAQGRVIWQQARDDGLVSCGIQFVDVSEQAQVLLEDWSLWDIVSLDESTTQVFLQGEFREHTVFHRLAGELQGRVEFDLSGVRYLNSSGVRKWVDFLRYLDKVSEYSFVRCSVAFINQASMVPEVLGSGRVESFKVPYACDQCDLEEERLLQTSALVLDGRWPPELPAFACPRCGGELLFDDLPGRFFAFLMDSGSSGR